MKPFDDEVYEGVVIEFIEAVKEEGDGDRDEGRATLVPDLYRIQYSDGDEEDVDLQELEAAIIFYKENGNVETALKNMKLRDS